MPVERAPTLEMEEREPIDTDPTPTQIRETPALQIAFASGEYAEGPLEGQSFLDLYATDAGGRVVGHQTYEMGDVENLHAFLGAWLRHNGKPTPAARAEIGAIAGATVGPAAKGQAS